MKKIILILLFTGLAFVIAGYYYAEKSMQRIAQNEKIIELEVQTTKDEEAIKNRLTQLKNNTMSYTPLELNEVAYTSVNPCLQAYIQQKTLSAHCAAQVLQVIMDDFSEEGMVNAIVGEAIDYNNLSFNHNFFKELFRTDASLKSKLMAGFLNKFRNPERLQDMFNSHKQHLYSNIPKSVYQNIFASQLDKCMAAYEEIQSKTDKEAFFKDIYFKADSQHLHDKYWRFTFWKRRALEKNDTVLYAILKDIKNHYTSVSE